MTNDVEHFSCIYQSFVYCLLWSICSNLLPILGGVVCVLLFLEFFVYPWCQSHACFTIIFSQLVSFLILFTMVSFLMNKNLKFWQSLIHQKNFKGYCFLWFVKNSLLTPKSWYSSTFFSKSFAVLAFTSRPRIHLNIIFVYNVGVKVHTFPYLVIPPPFYGWNFPFPIWLLWHFCWKSSDGVSVVLLLGSPLCTNFSWFLPWAQYCPIFQILEERIEIQISFNVKKFKF